MRTCVWLSMLALANALSPNTCGHLVQLQQPDFMSWQCYYTSPGSSSVQQWAIQLTLPIDQQCTINSNGQTDDFGGTSTSIDLSQATVMFARQGTCVHGLPGSVDMLFFCVDEHNIFSVPCSVASWSQGEGVTWPSPSCQSSTLLSQVLTFGGSVDSITTHPGFAAACVPLSALPNVPIPVGISGYTNLVVQLTLFQSTPGDLCAPGTATKIMYVPQNTCLPPPGADQFSIFVSCTGASALANVGAFVAYKSDAACVFPHPKGNVAPYAQIVGSSACVPYLTLYNQQTGASALFTCIGPPLMPTIQAQYAQYLVNVTFFGYDAGSDTCVQHQVYRGPLLVRQDTCFAAASTKSYRAVCQGDQAYVMPYSDTACTYLYGTVGLVHADECLQTSGSYGVQISCVAPFELITVVVPVFNTSTTNNPGPALDIPPAYRMFLITYELYAGASSCSNRLGAQVSDTISQLTCLTISTFSVHIVFDTSGDFVILEYSDTSCSEYVGQYVNTATDCIDINNNILILSAEDQTLLLPTILTSYAQYQVAYQEFSASDSDPYCSAAVAQEVLLNQGVCTATSNNAVALSLYCDRTGNVSFVQMSGDCTTLYALGHARNDGCNLITASHTRYSFACTPRGVFPTLGNKTIVELSAPFNFAAALGIPGVDITLYDVFIYIIPGVLFLLLLPLLLWILRRFKRRVEHHIEHNLAAQRQARRQQQQHVQLHLDRLRQAGDE